MTSEHPDDPPIRAVDAEVRDLEERAEGSSLAYRARHLNEAGDVCAAAGDLDRALRLWGRAIDGYLQVARRRSAAAICQKAIKRVPNVVRARCTLAILSVGGGDADAAIRQAEEYARVAARAGRGELAARQLRLMGRATDDPRIRQRLCELLAELTGEGDGSLPGEALGQPLEEVDRWPVLLLAAHMPPDEFPEI